MPWFGKNCHWLDIVAWRLLNSKDSRHNPALLLFKSSMCNSPNGVCFVVSFGMQFEEQNNLDSDPWNRWITGGVHYPFSYHALGILPISPHRPLFFASLQPEFTNDKSNGNWKWLHQLGGLGLDLSNKNGAFITYVSSKKTFPFLN